MKKCFSGRYKGRRVLVTGHTGFKGAWLCEWLLALGADVTGLSLPPATTPSLFQQLGLRRRLRHVVGDIRDLSVVKSVVEECAPDFVFHLAAQPLVRLSYNQPIETYATNVMGTVHMLEAIRLFGRKCTGIMVTSDKCYENRESGRAYSEGDPMGGRDPYSSSKGAAELIISAYRQSFFQGNSPIRIASARAGNVIGGGDWAVDRIVPDCIRSLQAAEPIPVRNKKSRRPWQHVLEPLSGYLWLGASIASSSAAITRNLASSERDLLCSAFNFGPARGCNRTVLDLTESVLKHWRGTWVDMSNPAAVYEAKLLNLSINKAKQYLGWFPVWRFDRAVEQTVRWYRTCDAADHETTLKFTRRQIEEYVADAASRSALWTE